MNTPRPNLKLVHPLDRYHFAGFERRRMPRQVRTRVDWVKLAVWSLVVGMGLLCWYGVLLLLWVCCT